MQLPFIKRAGTDPDALAYFARAGIASGTQTPSSYDNAASFNGTNQFLSVADNASINLSGTSFTICAWVNPISTGSGLKTIVAKWGSYALSVGEFNSVFFDFVDGSGTQRLQNLYAYGATANRWNFLCVSVDAGAISFSVNGINIASQGGVVQGPTTFSGALVNTTNPLTINGFSSVGAPYAGAIGPCAIWKRALSPSEVSQLWNSGAGRTYASLDTGLRTNLVSWWALNQNSVIADSHGTNTLTNNGSVTAPNIGPIVTTTQNSRQLINNFVKGIKSLGLWNSMVCWPLRSSQNAGGGATAFSLGGLGQFNGTLVNAPNWGSNGMTFLLASAQGISATVGNLTLAEQSLFAVSRTPVINAQQILIARNSTGGSQNGMNLRTNEATAIAGGVGDIGVVQQAGGSTILNIINSKDTNFSGYAVASNITNARLKRFPSTESADTALAFTGNLTNTDPLWIGRRSAASGTGDCTIPFASMFTRDIRSSWDQVYALYRQTLGLGLGLL
jgi:hypothetical protein